MLRTAMRLLTAWTALSVLAAPALAFKLTPLEIFLAPAGRFATQTLVVSNPGPDPAAIEIRMFSRSMSETGEEALEPADDQFMVFPSQLVLMAGEERAIRLQWMGSPEIDGELTFRLIAEQLPIDIGEALPQGGTMRLLMRYVASVYVAPEGVRADLDLVDAYRTASGDGSPQLALTFENRGNAHQLLTELSLDITSANGAIKLERDDLPGVAGENVLAGSRRIFLLPWPEGVSESGLRVDFSFVK